VSARAQGLVARAKLLLERARARWGPVDIAVRTFKRHSEVDGGSYAAALTYYTFLSLFPLLIFAVAALGYITFGNTELRQDIIDAGLDATPMLEEILTKDTLKDVESARRGLALTGVFLALYSGSGAVVALEHALNKINRVAREPNIIGKRLRSLAWLGILAVAMLGSTALTSLGRFTGNIFDSLGPIATVPVRVFFFLAAFAVSVGLFATAYRFLPATSLRWREVLPGAVVAAAGFEVLKVLGVAYFRSGAQARSATFGAFATAAGLLVASYLISQVTLLAAEVNAVLVERRITRQSSGTDPGGGQT
jgi:membrane protein